MLRVALGETPAGPGKQETDPASGGKGLPRQCILPPAGTGWKTRLPPQRVALGLSLSNCMLKRHFEPAVPTRHAYGAPQCSHQA